MVTSAVEKFTNELKNFDTALWLTDKPKTQKRGRQGYLVRYYKDVHESETPYSFEVVTQNGVVVVSSDLLYSSLANAKRSVRRLFNGTIAVEETVEV